MIGVIICSLILFGIPVAVYIKGRLKHDYDAEINSFLAFMVTAIFMLALFYPIIGFTGGLKANFTNGFSEGFLTTQSYGGMFYKTHEYYIQVGVGKQASLQEPMHFSTTDKDVIVYLSKLNGKRIKIYYHEWFIQPFSQGSSSRDVYKVEELDNVVK